MNYTFQYPAKVQRINGRRYGRINIPESHLIQTHNELMNRLNMPSKTMTVQIEVNASAEKIWEVAAGSAAQFFSHHPLFSGLTFLNSLDSNEGGQFILHRAINGVIFDRLGEVLVNLPGSQFTISDIEIADPSIAGFFPALYSLMIPGCAQPSDKTLVVLTYTMLGVAHPHALGTLVYQANSIKHVAEQAIGA